MTNVRNILTTVAVSALTTIGVVWGYSHYEKSLQSVGGQETGVLPANYRYAGYNDNKPSTPTFDFVQASQSAIPAVVHIKTKTNAKQVSNNLPKNRRNNPFSDLFDDDMLDQLFGRGNGMIPEQKASGSGVIISEDGYIVTNNHVVADADEVTVTMSDKKSYTAKVVASDPAYDLAVIKVDSKGLPYLVYGNSEDVKIGQWVLAIGYPLNLETTVTAGIVSAKARTLGLNRDKNGQAGGAVESYIQTDAAVNPGNSGGALINTDGKLIGINSAIASPTGSYAGYSYAIPVNIVKKVVDDLIRFGTVQRGYLGVQYSPASDMSPEEKKANGIPENAWGVYVTDVPKDGAAYAAGIKRGDVITSIENVAISSGPEMQEQISRFKPGDKVSIGYQRGTQKLTSVVTLKNKVGSFDVVKQESSASVLGADFATLDKKKATELGVAGGVVVKSIRQNGALSDQTRMRDGFIILKIDNRDVKSVDEMNAAIGSKPNVTVSGIYPGYDGLYDYQVQLK